MIQKLDQLVMPKFNFDNPGVSQGLLSTYCKCRVAFLIKMNRLRKIGKKTSYKGSMFHDFLLDYFTFIKNKSFPERREIRRALIKSTEARKVEFKDMGISDTEMEISLALLEVLALGYITRWGKSDLRKTIVKAEHEFAVKYPGYTRVGKVDLIFKNEALDLCIMEHKLKGRVDSGIEEALPLDLQCLFYTSTISKEFKKFCGLLVYDIIRNPAHLAKNKKDLKISALVQKLTDDIKKDPEHYYTRIPNLFSVDEHIHFNYETTHKVKEMMALVKNELQVYRNEESCHTSFYCDHLNVCVSNILNGYKQSDVFYSELEGSERFDED